jgi:SAM-dependent methyltransferase
MTTEPAAATPSTPKPPTTPEAHRLDANRALWDERVPIHTASSFYDIPGFVAGADPLRSFETAEVGDVTGKSLLHLQCHFGQDTLAWARHGATVTGLDFSVPAVEAARELALAVGAVDARFVDADVYDAVKALNGETFDIVYTGLGALNWLPEITRWAETVAALLAPGGFLYLAEFHPITDLLDEDDGRTVVSDYFRREPISWDEPGTYADSTVETENNLSYEWRHGLGEIVSALIGAGLRLEFLHEHDFSLFRRFQVFEQSTEGITEIYRFPAGHPRVPLMYSLRAAKQA